jgi:hypothetical protein
MTENDSGTWTSDHMMVLLFIIFIIFIFGLKYYFKYAA